MVEYIYHRIMLPPTRMPVKSDVKFRIEYF
jgi:hypothetical protein